MTPRDRERLLALLDEARSILASDGTAPAEAARPEPSDGPWFRGRSCEARYPGTCVVCGKSFQVGAAIVFADASRQCAHLGCGAPAKRGR